MWIYLKCSNPLIYSPALEVSPSPYQDIVKLSPIAKSNPIVKESCSPEWQVETSKTLPYGTISKHLMERNWELSTLSSAASRDHAKISQLQELEKAWQESEADCFSRSCAWPKKSSPHSYSWKTSQQLPLVGDWKSLERLPKWGMIVDGVLYPLQVSERYTKGNDGSCWPTPTARDATRNKGGSPADCRRKTPNLPTAILKMVATPCASQSNKPIREPSPSRQKGEHGEDLQDSIGRLNPESIGKRLSVEFVESLMGYPSMWSALEHWATQWFLSKRKKRSKS